MSLELRNYMNLAHPGMEISKPAYLKQRMKLNPDAFLELYHFHNRNFYSEPGFLTFHGYLVLAADGSDLNIPTTKETLERYGTASGKNTKPQAQIGLGCIYDVMNRIILESDCNRVKFDEMRLAERHYSASIQHALGVPDAYIMQRGGWSSDTVLKNVYRHVMEKETEKMNALTNSHLEKICNTK